MATACALAIWQREPLQVTFHPDGLAPSVFNLTPALAAPHNPKRLLTQADLRAIFSPVTNPVAGALHACRFHPGTQDPALYDRGMLDFTTLLHDAEQAHGHLCAGQSSACAWPCWAASAWALRTLAARDRKRLVTFVEIDRYALTDAIGVVTGCRVGKRALKLRDWGKMAATFVDLSTQRAIRIAATE